VSQRRSDSPARVMAFFQRISIVEDKVSSTRDSCSRIPAILSVVVKDTDSYASKARRSARQADDVWDGGSVLGTFEVGYCIQEKTGQVPTTAAPGPFCSDWNFNI